MEKLPMCRICLAEDVRMYVVVTKNLHELYERLTRMPFVTKDSRPILACSFCCAELKRSFRLLRRCLEAEELFAQIMKGNYEPKPLANQHEFIISPIESINIVEVCTIESVVVKEELPAVCETQDDIVEPKEEYQGDDLEFGNLDKSHLYLGNILPHDSESNLNDDMLLMEYKIEEEEEQEASKEECRAVEKNRLTVAEEPKLHLRRSKSEDSIPSDQKMYQVSDSTVIRSTWNRTSKAEYKKRHECHVCLRIFGSNYNLNRHFRIHTGEKPYKCDICQYRFSDKDNLKGHLRTHSKEKDNKCEICQMVFRRKPSLRMHIRDAHTGSTATKKPILHLRKSKSEDSIPADQKTKSEKKEITSKPYKCEICQSSFTFKSGFVHHLRKHTGEKPFKCNMCQKSFSKKIYLTHHIRVHTGEKPYKCDICQRSFAQKVSLERHVRTHTGEKKVIKRIYLAHATSAHIKQ